MREKGNAQRGLLVRPNVKGPLRRPRHMWEDDIKMDLREIRWVGMDWIHVAHNWD
jgi:hypothetical protein